MAMSLTIYTSIYLHLTMSVGRLSCLKQRHLTQLVACARPIDMDEWYLQSLGPACPISLLCPGLQRLTPRTCVKVSKSIVGQDHLNNVCWNPIFARVLAPKTSHHSRLLVLKSPHVGYPGGRREKKENKKMLLQLASSDPATHTKHVCVETDIHVLRYTHTPKSIVGVHCSDVLITGDWTQGL